MGRRMPSFRRSRTGLLRCGSGGGLRGRNRTAQIHRPAAFAYVIPVPVRNFDRDVPLHHRLATQALVYGDAGRHIYAILLIVVHFRKAVIALLDDHMAGGTGAVASAGVFELDAEIQRYVQYRLGLAMLGVGELAVFELNRFVEVQ